MSVRFGTTSAVRLVQSGCPGDAEALSGHTRATCCDKSGRRLCRELKQQFSRQLNLIFNTSFTSAVAPDPQQFESTLHGRLSAQIPNLPAGFTTNYGTIFQVNTASPQDRVMIEMYDALGQENLKTTRIAD